MEKMIDDLGRIVIPKDMRRKLKLDNGSIVNIELVEGNIVLTNPVALDYKAALDKIEEYVKENNFATTGFYLHSPKLLDIINKTKGE